MDPLPCRTCGYHSATEECPLCAHAPREASLRAARARGLARLFEGFRALWHGLRILLTTPRTKRLLVPPFLMSSAVFALVFVALALTASLVFLWCFSVVYEAFCGPFLDSVQARIEARWFGSDPRAQLEQQDQRPTFARRVRRELSTWLTSIKASLLALLVLLAFVWVKFLPLLGVPLFAIVAGFATALTLLDIPFSRRGWTVRQRLAFLREHLPEWISLGFGSGLCFVVPILGPLIGVPVASIGGLWLFVRLDKSALRAPERHSGA
jgi:uncharacterized protein involved in cysteine biosynthesis